MKGVLAVAAVAGALVGAPVASADTDPTTCDGSLAAGVIEGDVVVPAGTTCTVSGVRILGSAVIDEGALLVGDAQIEGDVTIASGGSFNVTDSAVAGDVVCRDCASLIFSFMWDPSFEITRTGNVEVRGATDVYIAIDGWRVGSLEVHDSTGEFTFIDLNASGDIGFTNNVGNAGFWFTQAGGTLEIARNTAVGGGFPADFTLVSAFAAKDLLFSRNLGSSYLETNLAEKDLECFGNDPAPTGWGNAAGKDVAGQCGELTGPSPE